MLGATYAIWKQMNMRLDGVNREYNTDKDIEDAEKSLERDYIKIAELEKELGLDDRSLLEALGEKEFPNPRYNFLVGWKDAVKAKKDARVAEAAEKIANAEAAKKAADEAEAQKKAAYIRTNLPRLVKESQTQAAKKHPDLSKAGSALNSRFLAEYRKLQSSKSSRLEEPDWPEKLADECAAATGSGLATR